MFNWHRQLRAGFGLRACVAVIGIAMALSGCSTVSTKLEAPKVTLLGVSMLSADIFSQQFRVRLHVDNPNTRELPIKRLEYKLFLEGDSFADGDSGVPFVVPAIGSTEFDLLVNAHFVSSLGRLLSRMNGDNRSAVRYDVVGKVVVDKVFVPSLSFHESGMVELFKK